MQMLLLGLNLLLFWGVWTLCWRKSALDHRRDQLFDLRDDARDWFINNGYSLSHPAYQALRKLLNSHLSFTEELTFRRYFATTMAMVAHPEVATQMREEVDALFTTDDRAVAALVTDVREQATTVMLSYMAETSIFMMLLVIAIWPFVALKAAFNKITELLGEAIGGAPLLKLASMAAFLIALPVRAGLVDNALNSSMLEEYSFKSKAI